MRTTPLGSAFEASLRVLLLLFSATGSFFSEERIGLLDYITVYANDYGYATQNLHGHSAYRFSEYPQKRLIIREALRNLVLDQFVTVNETENGFSYRISLAGVDYCTRLSSDYAEDYLDLAQTVISQTAGISDDTLLKKINANNYFSGDEGVDV